MWSLEQAIPGGRSLGTYEGLTHEDARWRPAELGALRNKVRKGLRSGRARVVKRGGGILHYEVSWSYRCDAPVVRHYAAVPRALFEDRAFVHVRRPDDYRRGVMYEVSAELMPGIRSYRVSELLRCRRCGPCKVKRSAEWAARAKQQYSVSAVTWLLTFTLSPFQHALIDAKLAKRAQARGASWLTDWSSEELFRARCREMGVYVSRWIDAVREAEARRRSVIGPHYREMAARAQFSYLLVAEEHRSEKTSTEMLGRPHYHMLIHELLPEELVRRHEVYKTAKGEFRVHDRSMLKAYWQLGHFQGKLCVDDRQASYLCKYLSEEMLWRVRASQGYGKIVEDENKAAVPITCRTPDEGGESVSRHPSSAGAVSL